MPQSHLKEVIETMRKSWIFFLKGLGLNEEERQIEFIKHAGLTKIRFSPRAIELLKKAFEDLHCCGKACKLKIEFSEDIVTVHAENFPMASAEISLFHTKNPHLRRDFCFICF
ncbi:MAG: hypothetical protein UR95_C0007G0024 [Parcubacteria group bacterium GW2011_GWC1_36_108]|nr:MAG: hypothetical protein UR95_C0007G0024 [Parcubacteria group bacterium GW2011_GWC1_36_108]